MLWSQTTCVCNMFRHCKEYDDLVNATWSIVCASTWHFWYLAVTHPSDPSLVNNLLVWWRSVYWWIMTKTHLTYKSVFAAHVTLSVFMFGSCSPFSQSSVHATCGSSLALRPEGQLTCANSSNRFCTWRAAASDIDIPKWSYMLHIGVCLPRIFSNPWHPDR